MQSRTFLFFFLALFIIPVLCGLEQNALLKTTNDLYLINPLDSSEKIENSTLILYSNDKYWTIETNEKDLFVILDKKPKQYPDKETIEKVLETYFFFSNISEQNNKKFISFFNIIPDIINQFNWSIELIKKQLETEQQLDTNTQNGLSNVQTRAKDIGTLSIEITNNLLNLDTNLKTQSFENLQYIKIISGKLAKNQTDMQSKLSLLQEAILKLKIELVDANISLDTKYMIGNQVLVLPQDIQNIPENQAGINANLEVINKAIEISSDTKKIENLKNNWQERLKRANFLKKYLNPDKDIEKQTKIKNAKDLFDTILNNKNKWKNFSDTNMFVNVYDTFFSYVEKKDYENAERQIKPLANLAIKIYKNGYLAQTIDTTSTGTETTQEEEQTSPLVKYGIIALACIIVVIIGIKIIKKIKEGNENKKEPEEQEINLSI